MGQRRKEEVVLTSLDGVTPEWLTRRLRASGCLPVGAVTAIEHRRIFSNNATSAVVAIDYSADTDLKQAPGSLFVKVANPGVSWNRVEFDFYTTIVPEMQRERPNATWPFPYAYDAAYSEDESGAHLLLEDLSLSHTAADAPLPPTPTQAQQVVEGLAAVHAYWWQDERLGNDVGQRLERPLLEYYHQQLLAHGVRDYDWELCWYDYRASVVRCIFFLVGGWDEKRPATMWWERLEKGLLAFEDLNCQDLFG